MQAISSQSRFTVPSSRELMQLGISQSQHSLVAALHQHKWAQNGQTNSYEFWTLFYKIREFWRILKLKATNSRTTTMLQRLLDVILIRYVPVVE